MSTGQRDARLNEPLPVDEATKMAVSYIEPDCAEAALNLQMDYILNRKALLTQWIIRHPLNVSAIIAYISYITYRSFGAYLSAYTFQNGIWEGIKALLANPFFRDNLVTWFTEVCFGVATVWLVSSACSLNVQYTSNQVPKKTEQYFGVDLKEYSKLAQKQPGAALTAAEKKEVATMKENSKCIVYRNSPIAMIVKQEVSQDKTSAVYKVTAMAVRRVYIDAGVFEDMLGMLQKDLKAEATKTSKVCKLLVDVDTYETADEDTIRKAGFKLESEKQTWVDNWMVRNIYRVNTKTFAWEASN